MRHLKEWLEPHKPSQIIVALPGNLSKGKPLSFDSLFQGITIKTEFTAKIKNPSWVWFPFCFPATPTPLFLMYILGLCIFFSASRNLQCQKMISLSWDKYFNEFWFVLQSYFLFFSVSAAVEGGTRGKSEESTAGKCWNLLVQSIKSCAAALDGFLSSESCSWGC